MAANNPKPGKISNKAILKDAVQLKQGILENYDFFALSGAAWAYLSSWHGYDFAIQRFLDFDTKTESLYLRLY